MTPDIREKAERLLAEIRANDRQPLTLTSSADIISQALLEAHKAGREEMREEAAGIADLNAGSFSVSSVGAVSRHIATAIRSIK